MGPSKSKIVLMWTFVESAYGHLTSFVVMGTSPEVPLAENITGAMLPFFGA